MNQIDTMLIPYARQAALKLVYNLANNNADKFVYKEAKTVLERSVTALDDGQNPMKRIQKINGAFYEGILIVAEAGIKLNKLLKLY